MPARVPAVAPWWHREVVMGRTSGITENDLRRVLDVVSPDAVADDGPELPQQVLVQLGELIPCAAVSFFVMDTRRATTHAYQEHRLADLPHETEDEQALFFDAYWDCLACCYAERYHDHQRVTMWQDFYTEREYRSLLMSQYFLGSGLWHELLVTLPPQGGRERRLLLVRELGEPAFTERDRLLLTLLRPHLADLRDRVEAERRTVPVLTARQHELLRRLAEGDTNRRIARDLGLSEATVRKHLENIYARLEVHSRTEAVARMTPALLA
jgi:DNA-binding CsgD family transcriptional regulator